MIVQLVKISLGWLLVLSFVGWMKCSDLERLKFQGLDYRESLNGAMKFLLGEVGWAGTCLDWGGWWRQISVVIFFIFCLLSVFWIPVESLLLLSHLTAVGIMGIFLSSFEAIWEWNLWTWIRWHANFGTMIIHYCRRGKPLSTDSWACGLDKRLGVTKLACHGNKDEWRVKLKIFVLKVQFLWRLLVKMARTIILTVITSAGVTDFSNLRIQSVHVGVHREISGIKDSGLFRRWGAPASSLAGKGVFGFCDCCSTLGSSPLMGTVHKETKSSSRRTEPPDPVTESRFWQSDESDTEEQLDAAVQDEGTERNKKAASKKGKNNPSRLLDGTMETALRRYGLRSDDSSSNLVQRNNKLRKSKSNKLEGLKQAAHPYRLDKENKPAAVNRYTEDDLQRLTNSSQGRAWDDVTDEDAMQHGENYPGNDSIGQLTNVCMQVHENEGPHGDDPVEESNAKLCVTEDLGPVMVNTEYAGDSVLASLLGAGKVQELEMGEEEEISSDQSNKSRSFTTGNVNSNDINPMSMQNLQNENEVPDTIIVSDAWMVFNEKPTEINWTEKWSRTDDLDSENMSWNDLVLAIQRAGQEVNKEERMRSYESAVNLMRKDDHGNSCNFFEESMTMVESLAEWIGSLKVHDLVVGKKRKSISDQRPSGLDNASGVCQKEKEISYQQKKKHKRDKGKKKKSDGIGATLQDAETLNDTNVKQSRKKYKIWFSKNRKPEKNLSTRKVFFSSEVTLPKVVSQPLGFSGFNSGTCKEKVDKNKQGGTPQNWKIKGEFYKEAAEREEELMGFVTTIISKSGNDTSKLLNSIKSKKSCFITVTRRKGVDRPQDQRERYRNYGMARQEHQEHSKNNGKEKDTGGHFEGMAKGAKKKNVRKPLVSVVETTNRYSLLDEVGNEIMDTSDTMVDGTNEDVILNDLNSGWIKKQERNLNAKYTQQVTKEQRDEAKKYVLDKLVPLRTVLSTWSIFQLEYFRCLYSLYNFGEGFLAVSSDSYLGAGKHSNNSPNQDEDVEEVESETDDTAEFMIKDIHYSPPKNAHVNVLEPNDLNSTEQPDHEMEPADVHPHAQDLCRWERNWVFNRIGMERKISEPMINHKVERKSGTRKGGTWGSWLINTFVNNVEYSMMRIRLLKFTQNNLFVESRVVVLQGDGLAHKCYPGWKKGWVGTKCTRITLIWRDGKFSNTYGEYSGWMGRGGVNVSSNWCSLIRRWLSKVDSMYSPCKGGETCMQYSTWLIGRGIGKEKVWGLSYLFRVGRDRASTICTLYTTLNTGVRLSMIGILVGGKDGLWLLKWDGLALIIKSGWTTGIKGFSSCLVTPVQSPVLESSQATGNAGFSCMAAVSHDVISSDIGVTAVSTANPTSDLDSCGPGMTTTGKESETGGLRDFPAEKTSQSDWASSTGPPNSAGLTYSVPAGLAQSVGPKVAGPVNAGIHPDGLSSGSYGPVSYGPTGLVFGLPGTDATGPFSGPVFNYAGHVGPISVGPTCSSGLLKIGVSYGPPFSSIGLPNIGISNLPDGPVFDCADGLPFNPIGPDNSVRLGADGLASSGPICSTDEILFGSVPSISTSGFNFVGTNFGPAPIATSNGIKITSRHLNFDTVTSGFATLLMEWRLKARKKKKNKQGMDGGPQPVLVSHVGPMLDSGPKLVSHAVIPSVSLGLLPEAQLKQKGKLHVTNQFAPMSDSVLDTMDDFYDGALGIWESERQYAHFYHDSGLKPPGFVFEKWTPKHKEYYFHLSKEVIKDQGGPSTVVEVTEDDDVTDVDSATDESSRFMKLS
ncbi:hypothetical protein L1987_56709 [Smallanthus sonchifolius]|uniref:Uncharacterized protein n=1 Tax=Smallanthus sonchifolius TaxID=185202 RepID=A0ACB9EDG2_9ASTR|nr:hypothetical protein L1987_56709 [Smallanthus sonchifolius]